MNKVEFVEWLEEEMRVKNISRAELARLSGISPPQISKILNMQSAPSENSLSAIAHAVGYPPETVFRLAGLLPDTGEETSDLQELKHLYSNASDQTKAEILDFVRYKSKKQI